jgi:hypothetical protein
MHPIPGKAPGPHLHLAQVQVWWWESTRFHLYCGKVQAGNCVA